jgi:hypothetical protein
MGVWQWQGPCRSGNHVPRPSADSSFGWRYGTVAGQTTCLRGVDSHAHGHAPSTIRCRNPSSICFLIVCWRGWCGPPAFAGGTERTTFRLKWSRPPIGFNLGVEGGATCTTTRRVSSSFASAFGGIGMTLSFRVLPPRRL